MRVTLEILHQVINRVNGHSLGFDGQVSINGGSGRGVMTEILLDDPQVNACLQQMGSVRMSEGMDRGAFMNARFL